MREKLIELLEVDLSGSDGYEPELIADHLIANGVTLANQLASSSKQLASSEWIPVTERLPDAAQYDWVLVQVKFIPENIYGVPISAELINGIWYDAFGMTIDGEYEKVTHWMPLPDPPKGE